MSGSQPLWKLAATDVVQLLHKGEVTPGELVEAAYARIEEVDGIVNALPTRCVDRARARAAELEKQPPHQRGLLAGLPVVIKDSMEVAGVRTTFGSRAFRDHVPAISDHCVERLEANGAIVLAKSNTPEFEAGANTFNDVFDATLNPWDTRLTAGGSSGGSAVAVATGMAWLAQGSDFACSLRCPASFCGVVGLRPTPGLLARGPRPNPFDPLSVVGPMARSVEDLALALDAMGGFDPRDPLSIPSDPPAFSKAVRQESQPGRIAFSADLGITPVSPPVRAAFGEAVDRIGGAGFALDAASPVLDGLHEAFRTLRAAQFAAAWGETLPRWRNELRDAVKWNIEAGLKLTGAEIAEAERTRARLRTRMLSFLDTHDFLITPSVIVPPFPVDQQFVTECDGIAFPDYIGWMAIGYAISIAGLPALSLPCGETAGKMPFAIQIIGRPHGEAALLAFASQLQAVFPPSLTPIDPRAPPSR